MILSRPFILRPVATALLMTAIVLAGLIALRFLPLSALPQVDFPTIQVQATYPGASPEVISQTVTGPLERQFGQMAGLKRLSSSSAAGVPSPWPSIADTRRIRSLRSTSPSRLAVRRSCTSAIERIRSTESASARCSGVAAGFSE